MITFATKDDFDFLMGEIKRIDAALAGLDIGPALPKQIKLYQYPAYKPTPTDTRSKVMEAMKDGKIHSAPKLTRSLRKTKGAISGMLSRLRQEGKIEGLGGGLYRIHEFIEQAAA